jgi:hypothetical protein
MRNSPARARGAAAPRGRVLTASQGNLVVVRPLDACPRGHRRLPPDGEQLLPPGLAVPPKRSLTEALRVWRPLVARMRLRPRGPARGTRRRKGAWGCRRSRRPSARCRREPEESVSARPEKREDGWREVRSAMRGSGGRRGGSRGARVAVRRPPGLREMALRAQREVPEAPRFLCRLNIILYSDTLRQNSPADIRADLPWVSGTRSGTYLRTPTESRNPPELRALASPARV